MNLMKKAAVSRHTCSTLSAQQDLPAAFICLSIHPFIYPPFYPSVHLFLYLFTQLSIHIPTLSVPRCLHLSLYPSIHHYTGKQRCRQDRYSLQLTRLVLVMYSRFIYFPGTNTRQGIRESNKMAAMV